MKSDCMRYLHKERELFYDVITATVMNQKRPVPIVVKDYYVTMILKQLAETQPGCVFKGGTSLSKCHHVIDRFSEDIDITFNRILTQGQRKKLKNRVISNISISLDLPISSWDNTRSRRNYNSYIFDYEPIEGTVENSLIQGVKMEVVLGSVSFPTVRLPIDSYVYQFLCEDNTDIVKEYGLEPFEMAVQSLDRTLIDKVFAICDYYINDNIKRHSRHIYDIYMLLPKVSLDEAFGRLVKEVRAHRVLMGMCPSAHRGVDIPRLLNEIIDRDIYRSDYTDITMYFQNKPIEYDDAI